MPTKPIIIECERVKFYAPHDEDAFFEWLNKIQCIKDIVGYKDKILLHMKRKTISNKDLRSLSALFRRYKIDLLLLEIFKNKKNEDFFYAYQRGHSINVYPVR